MSVKMPIYLKTGSPKKSKKVKLRDVLSADMISRPLGDFRHRSHIGKSGESDTFGDMSFLQGQRDLLSTLSTSKDSEGRAPPKPPRLHLEESEDPTAASVDPMSATSKATNNQPTVHSTTLQHNPPAGLEEALLCDNQTVNEDQQQSEDLEDQQCPSKTTVYESPLDPAESMFSFKMHQSTGGSTRQQLSASA
ncbi:cdc42 effector protein 2-like isoform X2 [Heterodontus francisci]|uniref:cdc42 effector protein 2-like isoform X2 n=1 Tax=Heterodontus francisci TaxID=7792 RepID=UPI00355B2F61